ncbi:MAG: glycosyltransferase family 4 protein, partial [Candidatus Hydrogenedentes bacterium]|nr:glycosyltransferase family 4 protein [Candidatus Hydrogenedentota bacterium]
NAPQTTIALDLSCAAEYPLTGVGYAAIYQVQALLRRRANLGYKVVATGDTRGKALLRKELPEIERQFVLPSARLLKYGLWTRFGWPPIEWFAGNVDIAHNLCHQTPAARRAVRAVTIHDLSFLRVPETHTERTVEVQTRLLSQCAHEADALIAVSEHCKAELVELMGVAPERIHVVPNGVRLEEFEAPFDETAQAALKARIGLDRDYFIQLGTLEPRKNIERLIQAYDRVRSEREKIPQLLLVGALGWKSDGIVEAIRAASGNGDVVLAGYLRRDEVILLLRGARACLYPSLYEGFGLPVLEAMAAGTPVMTSEVSALPEVVGETGLLVDPYDTESMASAICSLLDDPSAARQRAEAARFRAQSMTWEESAARLERVYRQLARDAA